MSPLEFLETVAAPNATALKAAPADIRRAVNAVLTIDAFFGIFFESSKQSSLPPAKSDDKYKDLVAAKSECYAVLRDLAFSLKHGALTHSKPRFVRRADQISAQATRWNDDAKWDDSEMWLDQAVIIETETRERVRADKLAEEVVQVALEELNKAGRRALTLADIASIWG